MQQNMKVDFSNGMIEAGGVRIHLPPGYVIDPGVFVNGFKLNGVIGINMTWRVGCQIELSLDINTEDVSIAPGHDGMGFELVNQEGGS